MDARHVTVRRIAVAILAALLLTTAGCSSLAQPGAESTTSPAPETTTETGTQTGTSTEAGTSTGTTTDTRSTTSDGHNHDHSGEGSSAADGAEATGKMAVVVNGSRVDLGEAIEGSSSFRVDDSKPDTWHANGTLTLSAALSKAGVDATASSLSYDGETYDEANAGTNIVYRVNGEPVDPTSVELQDGDEVWVLVLTDDTDASTPGTYIPPERLHVHGSMEFVVNGESLDFSRDKYQSASHNSHFHFEGGHARPWHAHSWSVTLAYALSTLDGINVTERGVTYEGTTYTYADGDGTSVTVTVNGESVDPTTYYLKDGDSVRVVVESES